MNNKTNYCDYCGDSIVNEKENHAGAFDDYCCKRCDDAACIAEL